jgi:hypothetical protein
MESLRARETFRETAGDGDFYVEDPTAAIAGEVVVRVDVGVIARRTARAAHLVDPAIGDEHLEVPVHRSEREARCLGHEGRVDLGRSGVVGSRAEPIEDPLALTGAISAGGLGHAKCRRNRGGFLHGRKVVRSGHQPQAKTRKIPVI